MSESNRSRKPFCDRSKTPALSERERNILIRLCGGDRLYINRLYHGSEIVNSFSWDWNDHERDSSVWMLIRRGLIYPTGVAGGAQWFLADKTKIAVRKYVSTKQRKTGNY